MWHNGPTIGIVKPSGGMNTWKRPLLPSRKLPRPGRLVKALGHHTMQPKAMPDMRCTMLSQEADKVFENIDPKSSEVYRLANQFRRENADVVGDKTVKNDAGEMSMSEDSKQKAWLEHYKGFSTLSLTGTQTTCLINHQWKARPSKSTLIWLRRLFHR